MKAIDILSLARENVKRLRPYSSARDDFKGNATVFLDANENPFPNGYNRYPDPHQSLLKEAIAKIKQVKPEQIFLGNGSDEPIDLMLRAFCEPAEDNIIIPQPTYGMYGISAEINNVEVIPTTLSHDFDLDTSAVLHAVKPKTKLIFICSPNNPSGNLLDEREIEMLLKSFSGIVVIDEAYIDFSDSVSWTAKLSQFKNLVVLQTFSKAWGLAGLRLGMCFGDPEIIMLLNKIKPPYNINAFTQSEVLKFLLHGKKEKERMVAIIKNERENLRKKLAEMPKIKKIHPSHANFLLVEVTNASQIYDQLVNKGIIVRDRSKVILCDGCLRITVGTPEENNQLIQALKSL